jgi:hypothetical protein
MSWIITIHDQKYDSDFLGVKETDLVNIDRKKHRIIKSSNGGITWKIVKAPNGYTSYGVLSIKLIREKKIKNN